MNHGKIGYNGQVFITLRNKLKMLTFHFRDFLTTLYVDNQKFSPTSGDIR